MNQPALKEAFIALGNLFGEWLANPNLDLIAQAARNNPWFTEPNVSLAFRQWTKALAPNEVEAWFGALPSPTHRSKKIGLVAAGNIPMAALHDMLCILASGNHAHVKLSAQDNVLLPEIFRQWTKAIPDIAPCFQFVEKLESPDAVIATGSNNSARHFAYYFRNIPHVIRRNRHGVAIITGNETKEQMKQLGEDLFGYFGLGCRSVSFLFLSKDLPIAFVYEPLETFSEINNHNKYANNYTYNRALMLMNLAPFFDNGFLLLRESDSISSPLAMAHFRFYEDLDEVNRFITQQAENIQNVMCADENAFKPVGHLKALPFGTAQQTGLFDYPDGLDIPQWLFRLS